MNTFHNQYNNQVKLFNNKIRANLAEYYFLEDLEELGKIKSFNTNSAYINEKYHIRFSKIINEIENDVNLKKFYI